jgi:hypothetical protein
MADTINVVDSECFTSRAVLSFNVVENVLVEIPAGPKSHLQPPQPLRFNISTYSYDSYRTLEIGSSLRVK